MQNQCNENPCNIGLATSSFDLQEKNHSQFPHDLAGLVFTSEAQQCET